MLCWVSFVVYYSIEYSACIYASYTISSSQKYVEQQTDNSIMLVNTTLFHCKILHMFVINSIILVNRTLFKSRKETPQKLTQLSSRSHPRHLVGKRTAQKDTTSDSQVNSNFPNKWSPASLTFNNYFYLFLYLYIT